MKLKLVNELSVELPRVIPKKLTEAIASELNMMSKELNKSLSEQSTKNLSIDLLEKLEEVTEKLSESIALLSKIIDFLRESLTETRQTFPKQFEKEQHEKLENEPLEEPYVFVLPYNTLDDSPDELSEEQTSDAYSEEETLDEYSDDDLDESTDEYLDSLIEEYSDDSMDELELQSNKVLGITDHDNKEHLISVNNNDNEVTAPEVKILISQERVNKGIKFFQEGLRTMPVLQEVGWYPPFNSPCIEDNADIEKLQPKFENVLISFRHPVTINELPDYYHIKYPMNLRNVGDRLTRGYYKKQQQCKTDMARIISDCRSYIVAENIYFRYANLLKCFLQGLWDERTENSCKEYIYQTIQPEEREENIGIRQL